MNFTCTLPLPPGGCSPNAVSSRHWRFRYKATKAYRHLAWVTFVWRRPAEWVKERPVEIDVVYACHRAAEGYKPRDVQNAIASLKAAIDGMVDAGIIPSDAARWLRWGSFELITTASELKRKGLKPGVTITVRVID